MLKNIVISVLGAVIISDYPWLSAGDVMEKIAIIMGLAVVLFIFLLFLEEMAEKLQRTREIKRTVKHLSSLELKKQE